MVYCLILLLCLSIKASDFGEVGIINLDTGTPAKVTSDSALYVTTDGDTSFVSVAGLSFNGDSALKVTLPGKVSEENTTTTPLDAGDSFVGDFVNTLNFAAVTVLVCSDKRSATNGLVVQWSTDSTMVCEKDNFTIPANNGKVFTFFPATKYLRIKYINGDTTQTSFNLQTILKRTNIQSSSHRISDTISGEDDAVLMKAAITGEDPNGTFQNVQTTVDGNLTISDNSSGLSIAAGNVTGTSFVHKFGNAPDFDAADGIVTVWDGADDGDIAAYGYVYSTSADINTVSSSSGSDAFEIEIQGLGSDSLILIDTATLNGQNKVTIGSSFLRVFRLKNINSTDNVGHVYCYADCAISSGVPQDNDSVRAVMQPGNNQTEMAVYTVPKGKTGYMRSWYASTAGSNKSSNYPIQLRARPKGGVFQLKHKSALSDNGTSAYHHKYTEPEVFQYFTDIEIRCSATGAGVTEATVSAGFDIVLIDN